MNIRYKSTRNSDAAVTASQAILKGLADDGGVGRNFFSGPVYLEFCRCLVCSWASFSLGLESFLL